MNKKFILIGEDDSFFGKIYASKLSKEGYDVSVVENGELVLEQAKVRKPDLILLDLIMPVKDGFETLRELKADSSLKDIKVAITSSLEQQEDIQKTKEMGAAGYIVKTDIQDIVGQVKKFL